MGIEVGDRAPDFPQLQTLLAKGPVVLYFYPKDETAGCTAQACSFRDSYEDFKRAGAEVVGVSSDSDESHDSFAKHHRLPFVLLSDKGGELRKRFGVPKAMLGFVDGRVTYVIDRSGVVRHKFNSLTRPEKHVREALGVLATLR